MRNRNSPSVVEPESVPRDDYTWAAWFTYDMEQIADHLGVRPTLKHFEDEHAAFPKRYRLICLRLQNDRYALLTQTEMHQDRVEIGLRHNRREFREADLIEILSVLPEDIGEVHKREGSFSWVS